MRRITKLATAFGAAALIGSSLGANAVAATATQTKAAASTPRIDHLFVIMLENHSQSSVIGDANAPYMNRLAKHYQMADRYYGVTHPSMPNYIATIAGDNFGVQDDEDENVVNLDRKNLVDQLENHGVRWGAYMEDLPKDKTARFGPDGTDDKGNPTTFQLYAKKHNPFVLFKDVAENPQRMRHVKDYSSLAADLDKKRAPEFVWITPNQCHDMHGGVPAVAGHPETPCPYGSASDPSLDASLKEKADQFVKQAVHTIVKSKAWTRHSAIVIVTDENDYTGNPETGGWEDAHGCCGSPYLPAGDKRVNKDGLWPGGTYGGGLIPAIIVSPQGPRHFVDHHRYNHYSLLRTIEDHWGMAHMRHAGDTIDGVHSMWHSFVR
ncbi:MAG: alkaline phosphatase family protein [Nocardioidaceae bacterium]